MVHTFSFIDLRSFDLKGISLHLLPFITSKSSTALVGAGITFLWEHFTSRLGKKDFFFFPTHDKAMKYDTEAGACTDRQNTEQGFTSKTVLTGRNCWPSHLLVRCEVRVPFLSRYTVCKWQPMSVKHGELESERRRVGIERGRRGVLTHWSVHFNVN